MYLDAHAHLDKYDSELSEALHEIEQNKIFTLSVSMDPESYEESCAIDARTEWVVSSFGIHPWNAPIFHSRIEDFDSLIDTSPMVGEIGLDYHIAEKPEDHAKQRDVFEYLVRKAVTQKKLLNIHTKGAEVDANRVLGRLGAWRAIIHCYSGPISQLHALAEKGYYFSIGVEILFSETIREIARAIPTSLLLTESDNPGGYRWLTEKTGMPTLVPKVVIELSKVRGWTVGETKAIIQQNFLRLIGDDPWATSINEKILHDRQFFKSISEPFE